MPGALILIQTEVGAMNDVFDKVKEIDSAKQVNMVTGPYDITVLVESENMEDITEDLIGKIREIDGVRETTTNIFIS